MKRSTQRILTTHVGSLARPHPLLDTMREKEHGRPYDPDLFARQVREAVAEVVRRQAEAGIDVVTDGEMGKVNFITYVKDRLAGFTPDEGPSRMAPSWQKEVDDFPEYYAQYFKKYASTVSPLRRLICDGSISYVGEEALATDIANLKAAVAGLDVEEVFMPSTGPSGFGANAHYASDDEYLEAVAEAMRQEYLGIVEAGLVLQVDDPWLIDTLSDPTMEPEARQRTAARHVEVLNHALRGIPSENIRHHTCYGLNHGPRMNDIPMREVVGLMLSINAGAHSFEVANPRHYHEWALWQDVKLPEGKILVPGFLGHANNYVEHPEMIAEYIVRYAELVGRENVIAGADCGFSSRASYAPEVHPTVVWPKFHALAEGAALATKQLWG
ncbi:MAG: methionine synthase [Acidimicrobiia bacterium]|nr:methionine synthase [Acidimicrobiia bacterium]